MLSIKNLVGRAVRGSGKNLEQPLLDENFSVGGTIKLNAKSHHRKVTVLSSMFLSSPI